MTSMIDHPLLLSLPDNEKIVQLCDIVKTLEDKIIALEEQVYIDRTVAYGDDIAPLKDVESPREPLELRLSPREDQESPREPPQLLASPQPLASHQPPASPKEPLYLSPVKHPKPDRDPPKPPPKKKSSGKKKETDEDYAEMEMQPYDPLKCRRRMWKGPSAGGYSCQCQKPVHENGLCLPDYNKLYGPKANSKWAEKETFPNGYYDDPRPTHDLINGKVLPWHDVRDMSKKSSKKSSKNTRSVADLRKEVSEKFPGVDTSKMKKPELLEKLSMKLPVEEGEPPVIMDPQKVQEDIPNYPEEDLELEEDTDDYDEDELDLEDIDKCYDDIEYEGVTYLSKMGTMYTIDYVVVGSWDEVNLTWKLTEDGYEYHEEHPDYEKPE